MADHRNDVGFLHLRFLSETYFLSDKRPTVALRVRCLKMCIVVRVKRKVLFLEKICINRRNQQLLNTLFAISIELL